MTKRTYGVLRYGSNAANQGMRQRMLVATVEASSLKEANAEVERRVVAGEISCYANQICRALVWSQVRISEKRELEASLAAEVVS